MMIENMKYMDDDGRDLPIRWNIMHMYSSSQLAKLVALRRGMDFELAAIAGALHDIAVIIGKKTEQHAEKSEPFLRDTIRTYNEANNYSGMEISKEEEDILVKAIVNHSDKSNYTEDPFVELLKDVDSVDRYLHGIKTDEDYAKRCERVFLELGIPIMDA
jgi:uncharacterized protein